MIVPRNYTGTRDLFGADAIAKRTVIDRIRAVVERFGFDPLETPGLELAETLTGKTGGDTGQNIYLFPTRPDSEGKQDQVGLRFDLTVPLARFVAQHPELQRPYRRYEVGMVWRADPPSQAQRRFRNFTQFDADIIGTNSITADAEIVALNCTVMRELGLKGVRPTINNRKIASGLTPYLGIDDARLLEVIRGIDKLDKLGFEGVEQELRRTLYADIEQGDGRVLNLPAGPLLTQDQYSKLFQLLSRAEEGDAMLSYLEEELTAPVARQGINEIREIQEKVRAMVGDDIACTFDFRLARGLDYYTGPIYETHVDGATSSVGGGGRFDNLASVFGALDCPGTGTSFGVDRITLAMQEQGILTPSHSLTQVLVTVFSPGCEDASLRIVGQLRRAGIPSEISLLGGRLKDQLAYANRKKIPLALILGPDEVDTGQVTVRKLTDERITTSDHQEILTQGRMKQITIPQEELIAAIQSSL